VHCSGQQVRLAAQRMRPSGLHLHASALALRLRLIALQCCVCVMSLFGLKYCHDHMARQGSAADDGDAAVIDESRAAGAAVASEAEMGSVEGDKRRLIHAA
jgi:hypothetical protein